MNRLIVLSTLFLFFSVNIHAASKSDPILDKINPAWQRLDSISGNYLSNEQQKAVYDLAFASVAAEICGGLDVDKQKFVNAFQIFNDSKFKSLSAKEQRMHEEKLLVLYGTAVGLLSAEGLLTKKEFCALAESLKKEPEGHYWK